MTLTAVTNGSDLYEASKPTKSHKCSHKPRTQSFLTAILRRLGLPEGGASPDIDPEGSWVRSTEQEESHNVCRALLDHTGGEWGLPEKRVPSCGSCHEAEGDLQLEQQGSN